MRAAPPDPERWQHLSDILDELLDATEQERSRKREQLKRQHPELDEEVESLLRAAEEGSGPLDRPIADSLPLAIDEGDEDEGVGATGSGPIIRSHSPLGD